MLTFSHSKWPLTHLLTFVIMVVFYLFWIGCNKDDAEPIEYPPQKVFDLSKVTEVKCDVMATIDWTCFNPNLAVQNIKSDVKLFDLHYEKETIPVCEHEWDYETTFTGSIPVKVTGDIYIRFNAYVTEIDSFFVHNTWNFLADDDELLQNGYPNTKTQVYSGHDLPTWVMDPAQNRYIYTVYRDRRHPSISTIWNAVIFSPIMLTVL